jgi:23S rRNA (cytidine2498-2'-O)-methyltransferase
MAAAQRGGVIVTGQAGYEHWLAQELAAGGWRAVESGAGWVRTDPGVRPAEAAARLEGFCFPHQVLLEPTELRGDGVNALAGAGVDWFVRELGTERLDAPWLWWAGCPTEVPGLARRLRAVEDELRTRLRKRLSRVVRLAVEEPPRGGGLVRGLWLFAPAFDRMWAARAGWLGGQRRMADDPAAPSRSYLKVEEAYSVLGYEPQPGETVADLGAAPGGWSFSAARRGARVVAVDNGPLKGGALEHPAIAHRREDAFRFRPEPGETFDWLFCDLVEEPQHVLRDLVEPWLAGRWCRRFVVNLKLGRAEPLALLEQLRRSASSPLRHCARWRVRHLYHDREEFTLVGVVGGG